jgi:hypothetical protein
MSKSLEMTLVDAMEPVIDQIVAIEKTVEKQASDMAVRRVALEERLESITAKMDTLAAQVREEVGGAADQQIEQVRAEFKDTIGAVKAVIDESLAAMSRAARDFEANQQLQELSSATLLVSAAQEWGS